MFSPGKQHLLLIYLLSVLLALAPFVSVGGAGESGKLLAASFTELLKPERWFNVFKENITIPIPEGEVKIPSPEEALKEASPKLQEINVGVREETGIDFAKFIGWFARVLRAFFQVIVNLLETVSQALGG